MIKTFEKFGFLERFKKSKRAKKYPIIDYSDNMDPYGEENWDDSVIKFGANGPEFNVRDRVYLIYSYADTRKGETATIITYNDKFNMYFIYRDKPEHNLQYPITSVWTCNKFNVPLENGAWVSTDCIRKLDINEAYNDLDPYGEEDWGDNNEYIMLKHQRIGEDDDFGWEYYIAKKEIEIPGLHRDLYYKVCTGDNFNRELLIRKRYTDERDKFEPINGRDARHILNEHYKITTRNRYGTQTQFLSTVPDEIRIPVTKFLEEKERLFHD
jgi:hypothetical protein